MKLVLSLATFDDALFIAKSSWERGRIESERLGFSDSHAWAKHLFAMCKDYGYVLRDGETPVCIFGAEKMDDKYYTFFAATEAFNEHAREITRFLRQFLRDRVAERPGVPLQLASACDHPRAHGWFEVLGFHRKLKDGFFSLYDYEGV